MELASVPDKGSEAIPSERADEAQWDLDEAQTAMSADNPVCQVCGSSIVH